MALTEAENSKKLSLRGAKRRGNLIAMLPNSKDCHAATRLAMTGFCLSKRHFGKRPLYPKVISGNIPVYCSQGVCIGILICDYIHDNLLKLK